MGDSEPTDTPKRNSPPPKWRDKTNGPQTEQLTKEGQGDLEEEVVSVSFAFWPTPQWTKVYIPWKAGSFKEKSASLLGLKSPPGRPSKLELGRKEKGGLFQPSSQPRDHSAALRFKGNAEQRVRTLAVVVSKRQEMPSIFSHWPVQSHPGDAQAAGGNRQMLRGDGAAQQTQRCLLSTQRDSDSSGRSWDLMSVNENTLRLSHSHLAFIFPLKK